LTTPIGPPRPAKDAGLSAVSPDSHASRFLAMPGPGARPRRLATRMPARRPLPIQRVRSQSSPHRCGVKLCVEYATHLVPGPVASPEGSTAAAVPKVRVNESRIAHRPRSRRTPARSRTGFVYRPTTELSKSPGRWPGGEAPWSTAPRPEKGGDDAARR
jgi:hypothetical protein